MLHHRNYMQRMPKSLLFPFRTMEEGRYQGEEGHDPGKSTELGVKRQVKNCRNVFQDGWTK